MSAAAVVRLRDVADIKPPLGVTPSVNEAVSFLPMAAVDADCMDAVDTQTRPFHEVSKGYTPFLSNDVLVAKITPCFENGKIAQAKPTHRVGFGSTEFHVVRSHADELDPRYLAYFLRQERIRVTGQRRMTGSAGQRRVPEHFLANLQIPLPPLPEQRRIAAILDQADALRAKRRAVIHKLDELTQSIFLDMFGDPATNPNGWPTPLLKQLFAIPPNFGTMIPPTPDGGEWLSLRVANIQDWQLDLADRKYVNLPSAAVSRHSVRDGDILLARAIASRQLLGKAIVAHPNGDRWAFDSHLVRLRFDPDQAEPEYIRHLLKTSGGRCLFLSATRRSAVQFNINTREVSALTLPIAPVSLQRKFSELLTVIDRITRKQRDALDGLGATFASLQQRAFRGEL